MLEALKVAVYKRLSKPLQVQAVRWGTPNFTVGSIGLVTDGRGRLLLVRPTYRQGWLPPGGFLGRREVPTEALRREVFEELGLRMSFAEAHRVYFDVRRQGVTFVCVGVLPDGQEPRVRGPELTDVRWFALDEIPPMPEDFHEDITEEDLEAVRRAGRPSSAPG